MTVAAANTQCSKIEETIAKLPTDATSPVPVRIQKAIQLARVLQKRAVELQTPQERRQQAELDRMIQNPNDKATLTQLTDQAFRSETPHRAADQLIHILDVQGIPRFFSPLDRTLLKGFQTFGAYLPGVTVPMVKKKMHSETANVVLPAEREMLAKHLSARAAEGVRMNVNYLGEAILSEKEAQKRLEIYLDALKMPEVEVVSVKISTIYSQVSPLAREHTLEQISIRLAQLYRAAAKEKYVRPDGSTTHKFVYLDMEEYKDLHLTAEVFMRTLEQKELTNTHAGIVLQAYIPDSYNVQKRLNTWARERVAAGGAPIIIRVVKGANMEMERVEASIHDWPQTPYKTKLETDANYKRILLEGMKEKNLVAIRLGIASHNLFELAYSLVLASESNALDKVQFEMLEGMSNHQRRAIFELCESMLLYAPACGKEDFIHAIGYLIRRLDENTGPENFLRHAFRLEVDSPDWKMLEKTFIDSHARIETLGSSPRRTQDRNKPIEVLSLDSQACSETASKCDSNTVYFQNEPDTDFSLPQNGQWAEKLIATWLEKSGEHAANIPLEIAGNEITAERQTRQSTDPSRPGVVVANYKQATRQDADTAIECAASDPSGWRSLSCDARAAIMQRVAQALREARGDLMGAAMVEGGKTLPESDPEVSEAVDFVEFYTQTAERFHRLAGLSATGRGVVVVVSPWNFPIAIPCGGIAAALAAGNTVILKPASDTVLIASILCSAFWSAGVPKTALQLMPCSGGEVGSYLVSHQSVDTVILTGGTETALSMLKQDPTMQLLAETGGKNATIVTALSDRDQAIKHVIQSAFGHAGQKCSATSLLILEKEVYEDLDFKRALCEAVESLPVGPAYELQTKMGPTIRKPSGDLERGLTTLDRGESWAVLPKPLRDNTQLYSPGLKWDVQPNSYTHNTEFFGPLLAVMQAKDLHEAIQLVNATGFGLTSGLESLDIREQKIWKENIRAGNLYINRGTTGAIVLRQPFGGMGKSAFGPGIKAGGPNYVAQLMNLKDVPDSEAASKVDTIKEESIDALISSQISELLIRLNEHPTVHTFAAESELQSLQTAVQSYATYYANEFGAKHDTYRLIGQDNVRRYLPIQELRIRVQATDHWFDAFLAVCAAKTAGCRITLSRKPGDNLPWADLLDELTESWAASIEFVEETDEELAQAICDHETNRVRYLGGPASVPLIIRKAAPQVQLYIADQPVLQHGRIELLWYFEEQSLCVDYHRYGNLGVRSGEQRAETL